MTLFHTPDFLVSKAYVMLKIQNQVSGTTVDALKQKTRDKSFNVVTY